jgi:hypothetical protein
MLQAVREAFGAFGGIGRSTGGDVVGDPAELALDSCLDPVRRSPDQRIQPADGEVEPVGDRERLATGTVLVE